MAKDRFVGARATVRVVSGNTNSLIGLCTQITPPPLERAIIDVTGMEDTYSVGEPGIEQMSEFSFVSLHDPADTGDDAVDTLYAGGNTVTFTFTATGGGKTFTKSFTGKITGVTPSAYTGNEPVLRTVKGIRTSAVTDTSA